MLVAHRDTVNEFNLDPEHFELKQLASLPCAVSAPQIKWIFDNEALGQVVITPNTTLRANDLALVLEAALRTKMLAYVPTIVLRNVQNCDQLVSLSGPGWTPQTRTLYAVYTASRKSSQKVKAVINYARQAFYERFGEQEGGMKALVWFGFCQGKWETGFVPATQVAHQHPFRPLCTSDNR